MDICHDHQHCIDDALANAQDICAHKGMRLTALREQVLRLIWQSHKPLGAYDLLDMLAAKSERRIAPPTVYRALDFLLEAGMVHRINSLNAYIGCPNPNIVHPSYFLICKNCQDVGEIQDLPLTQHISQLGEQQQFAIDNQWLEVMGLCQSCQQAAEDAPSKGK